MKTLLFCFFSISFVQSFVFPFRPQKYLLNIVPSSKKYPLSQNYYDKFLKLIQPNNSSEDDVVDNFLQRNIHKYPLSRNYYESFIKRLNSKNISEQTNEIMGSNDDDYNELQNKTVHIVINKHLITTVSNQLFNPEIQNNGDNNEYEDDDFFRQRRRRGGSKKSENFEVITECLVNFTHVGGYEPIKKELTQCVDLLTNFTKYSKFNVRVPKGLIFEGPPGNGKTLLAKALAGEAKTGFIAVINSI